jgi:hypothetical protein
VGMMPDVGTSGRVHLGDSWARRSGRSVWYRRSADGGLWRRDGASSKRRLRHGHQWCVRRGRAAAIYSLIGTAKLNSLDPEAYLRNELSRIAGHPVNHRGEAVPWNVTTNPAEQSFHLAQLPKLFFSMARHGGRIHLLRSVQPKCF